MHAAVALADAGRELIHWGGANSEDGWQGLLDWAKAIGGPRQWAIEGAWNYGRGLAQHLVAAGATVYEVNARWTALGRRHARQPGKTDRLDARAVARLVRQEAPKLRPVGADDVTTVLDLLTSEREAVLGETTRLWNQAHALLVQLDPGTGNTFRTLESPLGLAAMEAYRTPTAGMVEQTRAAAVGGSLSGSGSESSKRRIWLSRSRSARRRPASGR